MSDCIRFKRVYLNLYSIYIDARARRQNVLKKYHQLSIKILLCILFEKKNNVRNARDLMIYVF